MKLVTFDSGGSQAIGIYDSSKNAIFSLTHCDPKEPTFRSMLDLIDAGPSALEKARGLLEKASDNEMISLETCRLLAPLPLPRQIRDFSVFPEHIKQAPAGMARIAARRNGNFEALATIKPLADVPPVYRERPIYYFTNRFSVAGPGDDVIWPRYSKIMDFELECAAVIGKGGKEITVENALSHVFGYMIYNDFSARDMQNIEMQGMLGPAKGKSFDKGNVMGPWLVTADEVGDPQNLAMSVSVNGELWSSGNTAEMLHGFADLIAYVTADETIYAGEVFGSGTMGNGCGLEMDRFLSDGDLVTLHVEGLGALTNRVVVQKD
jgi:2-keto-4-pentenoate hydratase/2-oxohepta-3-ene-1,7-dioic acid hydratase in catechol pathway